MAGSIDIVEHHRARPFPVYSISYYIAEYDFFYFHMIQMPKMSLFTTEPRVQRHKQYTQSCLVTRV